MTARPPIPGVSHHARQRMQERLGRDLTRAEWLAAVAAILEGRALLLCVQPCGGEHYLHEVGGVALRLIWRPAQAMVVTVLPAEWGASAVIRTARAGPVRKSLRLFAHYRQGRLRRERTAWREDA